MKLYDKSVKGQTDHQTSYPFNAPAVIPRTSCFTPNASRMKEGSKTSVTPAKIKFHDITSACCSMATPI